MRKISLWTGRKWLALGVLCTFLTAGAGQISAAEKTAMQAAGNAVDEKEAEEIAFADAGITADQVGRLKTKAEREDGEAVYEVSFTVDSLEYEYLIREADGKILEWEVDGRDVGTAVAEESLRNASDGKDGKGTETGRSGETDTPIGLEQAKNIALSDAGLSAEDVRFSKIKYEEDGRTTVYEIEFYQDRTEFEYTIDAYSGEVRKMERDS